MEGVVPTSAGEDPVQPGEAHGAHVLETREFWTDLHGFLEQRLKSSDEAGKVRALFERDWRSGQAKP